MFNQIFDFQCDSGSDVSSSCEAVVDSQVALANLSSLPKVYLILPSTSCKFFSTSTSAAMATKRPASDGGADLTSDGVKVEQSS